MESSEYGALFAVNLITLCFNHEIVDFDLSCDFTWLVCVVRVLKSRARLLVSLFFNFAERLGALGVSNHVCERLFIDLFNHSLG